MVNWPWYVPAGEKRDGVKRQLDPAKEGGLRGSTALERLHPPSLEKKSHCSASAHPCAAVPREQRAEDMSLKAAAARWHLTGKGLAVPGHIGANPKPLKGWGLDLHPELEAAPRGWSAGCAKRVTAAPADTRAAVTQLSLAL